VRCGTPLFLGKGHPKGTSFVARDEPEVSALVAPAGGLYTLVADASPA
jgi:hypothetical protein